MSAPDPMTLAEALDMYDKCTPATQRGLFELALAHAAVHSERAWVTGAVTGFAVALGLSTAVLLATGLLVG